MTEATLSLFEAYGIEIESMVVDASTLDVRPITDEVLRAAAGGSEWVEDFDDGPIGWSNELVAHVIELKTNGPAPSLSGLADAFRTSAAHMRALLVPHAARLMPTGMHPWMDPTRETRIWPHESGPVYRAYDELYDCRRHGWANLQSVHLNLPFSGEGEFERLLAAVRVTLPLIPALAASSPIVEGRVTGTLDNRLVFCRSNADLTPAMSGDVVPEPIYSFEAYRRDVLGAVARDLEAVGAAPILRGAEWTNARGAIARFDRMAVEVRVIDAQECARADLAVAAAVTGIVRALVDGRWSSTAVQAAVPTAPLARLLARVVEDGPATSLDDDAYVALFGPSARGARTAGELLQRVVVTAFDEAPELEQPLEVILREGTLAERILRATGPTPDRERLRSVWSDLCDCLDAGESFRP